MSLIERRLRSEDGMTLIELMVAGLLGSVLLIAMGGFLMSTMRAGSFTQGQSATLNDVRNAMQQVEKEVRGAESINWDCGAGYTTGECLIVGAQTPTSEFRTVRYAKVGTELQRSVFDSANAVWASPRTVIERVMNTGSQDVFGCDEAVTLLRVIIDLHIEPTPSSGTTMNVQTSVRPRNFPSSAGQCP
jgi:type II secretory pathway component PulJ